MTAHDVRRALWQAHQPPAWAFLAEVANATGFAGSRRLDAVAMSLYPSRGLELHGFEIKVSRSDFLREIKDADKAEDMIAHLDRFWIVAPSGIAKAAELPAPWGLKTLHDSGTLRTAKQAELLGDTRGTISRPFVAAMLRRATEAMVPRATAEELAREASEAREAADRARDRNELESLRNECKVLTDERNRVLALAGSSRWAFERVLTIAGQIAREDLGATERRIKSAADEAIRFGGACEQALAALAELHIDEQRELLRQAEPCPNCIAKAQREE